MKITAGNYNFLINPFIKLCLYLVEQNLILSLFADQIEAFSRLFVKSRYVRRKMEALNPNLRHDVLYM